MLSVAIPNCCADCTIIVLACEPTLSVEDGSDCNISNNSDSFCSTESVAVPKSDSDSIKFNFGEFFCSVCNISSASCKILVLYSCISPRNELYSANHCSPFVMSAPLRTASSASPTCLIEDLVCASCSRYFKILSIATSRLSLLLFHVSLIDLISSPL